MPSNISSSWSNEPRDQQEAPALDRANQVIAKLSGMVLVVAGLGLAALATSIIARQFTMQADIENSALLFSAVVAIVALVCGTIGLRLTFNRPNRYHSLLPPVAWYAMAFVFALLGSGLGLAVARRGEYDQLVGAACAILFAFWCWKAGRTAAARGRSALA
jgi:hypothetical protein